MTLREVKEFGEKCFEAGIEIPRDVKFVCTNWNDDIPEEYRIHKEVEFNHWVSDDDVVVLTLIPAKNGI